MGSGKSTVARRLEAESPAVRLALDEWILRLTPQLALEDPAHGERAAVARALLSDFAEQVLRPGSDAILDWNS